MYSKDSLYLTISVVIPFSSNILIPFPFILGLGSLVPIVTCLILLCIIAFVHGGVFNSILHGSRVVYRVLFLTLSPADFIASISA